MCTPASDPTAPVPAMGNDPGGLAGEVVSADGVPVRYAVYGGGLPAIVFSMVGPATVGIGTARLAISPPDSRW